MICNDQRAVKNQKMLPGMVMAKKMTVERIVIMMMLRTNDGRMWVEACSPGRIVPRIFFFFSRMHDDRVDGASQGRRRLGWRFGLLLFYFVFFFSGLDDDAIDGGSQGLRRMGRWPYPKVWDIGREVARSVRYDVIRGSRP
jgi:hypothetical protein